MAHAGSPALLAVRPGLGGPQYAQAAGCRESQSRLAKKAAAGPASGRQTKQNPLFAEKISLGGLGTARYGYDYLRHTGLSLGGILPVQTPRRPTQAY